MTVTLDDLERAYESGYSDAVAAMEHDLEDELRNDQHEARVREQLRKEAIARVVAKFKRRQTRVSPADLHVRLTQGAA